MKIISLAQAKEICENEKIPHTEILITQIEVLMSGIAEAMRKHFNAIRATSSICPEDFGGASLCFSGKGKGPKCLDKADPTGDWDEGTTEV